MNIQRWITHCDTIWDIFKNPILIELVLEWHEIKKGWKALKVKKRNILQFLKKEDWEVKFTPEYYEFIREVFDERTNMESFLDYVRESIIVSDTLYGELQKYWPDNLVKALLSFDELNDQLAGVTWLTVAWVFKARIADIIRDAYTTATHMEDDENEDEIYDTPWLYYALEKTLEEWLMPINSDGEMIVKLWDGNTLKDGSKWHIVTSIWGNGEIYEVDRLWNRTDPWSKIITIKWEEILDSREKLITRIKLLEKIIEYHYSDGLDILEEVELFYANLRAEFESWHASLRDIPTGNFAHIHFWMHLVRMKNDLIESLKKMDATDTTQIDKWEKDWREIGISTHLPEESSQAVPKVRWIELKIIT